MGKGSNKKHHDQATRACTSENGRISLQERSDRPRKLTVADQSKKAKKKAADKLRIMKSTYADFKRLLQDLQDELQKEKETHVQTKAELEKQTARLEMLWSRIVASSNVNNPQNENALLKQQLELLMIQNCNTSYVNAQQQTKIAQLENEISELLKLMAPYLYYGIEV